jgi:hypothetical protein
MSLLKKIGGLILKLAGLVPEILPFFPGIGAPATAISELSSIAHFVVTAEGMFAAVAGPDTKTGSEKLKAATPYVSQVVQAWINTNLAGKKIQNAALFEQGCTELTGGMADVLNSLGD